MYSIEDDNGSLIVEATPDFYTKKLSPVICLITGETQSVGSRQPDVQLAIGALGALFKLRRALLRQQVDPIARFLYEYTEYNLTRFGTTKMNAPVRC